ncbi:hypothetical protein [Kitasatospora purpeofusca]|uniref:hypothetical protein n=1 Tax=Kitasatospora purpeofusca TaxID=67352 RepID=UPI0038133574
MPQSRSPGPETPPDPLAVTIGAREVYDAVLDVQRDVRALAQAGESVREELDDHENRLRDLERWKYTLPIAAVSGVVAATATVAKAIGKA